MQIIEPTPICDMSHIMEQLYVNCLFKASINQNLLH